MNILVLMGSPRKKGNTYKVTEQLKSGLLDTDSSIVFENIFLADCNLKMCRGCYVCFAKGENFCPLKDDLKMIYEKMLQADGVILAAPTYAMGVPALMKNFIDRLSYTLHRPVFFDQSFLAVSTIGGFMGLKQALAQLSLLASGAKISLKIGVVKSPFKIPMVERKTERKLRKTVKRFYHSLKQEKRHKPGFGDLAYFNAFKAMSQVESYKKKAPADFKYYERNASYFYSMKGKKAGMSKVLHSIMMFVLRLLIDEPTGNESPGI